MATQPPVANDFCDLIVRVREVPTGRVPRADRRTFLHQCLLTSTWSVHSELPCAAGPIHARDPLVDGRHRLRRIGSRTASTCKQPTRWEREARAVHLLIVL